MKCKLVRYEQIHQDLDDINPFENPPLRRIEHTCDEVRHLKDIWLQKYREDNKSDYVHIDLSYEKYKREIEDFLTQCKCKAYHG